MHSYAGDNRLKMLGAIATVSVAVAIVVNFVWDRLGFEYDWLVSAPTVAGAFAGLHQLVDARLWKWSPLHRIGLIDTPVIDGVYVGTLNSTWPGDPVPIRIQIDQRWTNICIRFEVTAPATSNSLSVTAALQREGHRDAALTYTYKNAIRPATAGDDMRDHDGTADVTITRDGKLSGRYFNARGRQGELAAARTD